MRSCNWVCQDCPERREFNSDMEANVDLSVLLSPCATSHHGWKRLFPWTPIRKTKFLLSSFLAQVLKELWEPKYVIVHYMEKLINVYKTGCFIANKDVMSMKRKKRGKRILVNFTRKYCFKTHTTDLELKIHKATKSFVLQSKISSLIQC